MRHIQFKLVKHLFLQITVEQNQIKDFEIESVVGNRILTKQIFVI